MTVPEPSPPVRRAAAVLFTAEPAPGLLLDVREALAAALDVEEIAKVLAEHVDFVIHDGRIVCHNCGADLGPDDETAAGWELHERHVAQVIRTRILGEAP